MQYRRLMHRAMHRPLALASVVLALAACADHTSGHLTGPSGVRFSNATYGDICAEFGENVYATWTGPSPNGCSAASQ